MAEAVNSNTTAVEKLDKYLKDKGMRRTPERYKILEQVMRFAKQFAVDDLLKAMQDNSFVVSKATVYNTVELLVDAGILRRLSLSSGRVVFERAEAVSLIHLLCEHCNKVKLVKDVNFMAYMNARKFAAFTSNYYNLTIYGVCNDCARRIKREKRELAMSKRNNKK